jgi:hypothetical protein
MVSRLRQPRHGVTFDGNEPGLGDGTAPPDDRRREGVRVAHALWRDVWNAAAAGIRASHPDWPESQVQDGVRELMRGASGS